MLYYALFQDRLDKTGFASIYEALELIHKEMYSYFKQEISEIISYLLAHLQLKTMPLGEDVFAWT